MSTIFWFLFVDIKVSSNWIELRVWNSKYLHIASWRSQRQWLSCYIVFVLSSILLSTPSMNNHDPMAEQIFLAFLHDLSLLNDIRICEFSCFIVSRCSPYNMRNIVAQSSNKLKCSSENTFQNGRSVERNIFESLKTNKWSAPSISSRTRSSSVDTT